MWLAGAVLAGAALGGVIGFVIGPWAMTMFMGPDYLATPMMMGVLIAATVVMAGALLQVAVFVALERYWLSVASWGAAVLATIIALIAGGGSNEDRGMLGFTVAALVAFAVSGALLRWATSHHDRNQPSPQ